jgi:hypothetical protein
MLQNERHYPLDEQDLKCLWYIQLFLYIIFYNKPTDFDTFWHFDLDSYVISG